MHVLNYIYLGLSYPFVYLDMHIRTQSNLVALNQIIDFYLTKKGSFHLSGIRFCDFSYILYLYTQTKKNKKTGLDSVVLKVCKKKKMFTLRGQYDPTLK